MVRCQAVRYPSPGARVQCTNLPAADSSHYGMVYDPRMRVPPGTTVYFCPPCSDRLVRRLMAVEGEVKVQIIKKSQKAKSLVKAGHESAWQRDRLWGDVNRLKVKRTHLRNRWCRLCDQPLEGLENEPHFQRGRSFAHVDIHSARGYGRAWIMFHTQCMVRWLKMNVALPDRILATIDGGHLPRGQQYLLAAP